MADVLVIGVAVADFVFALDTLPDRPTKYRTREAEAVGGGCAANAAVAITRLGGAAHLGVRLGDDHLGDVIVDDLAAEGVDTSLVQRTPGARSSFSSVIVDAAGERQVVNFRGEGLADDADWIADCPPPKAVLADTRWSAGAARALDMARAWGVPGVIDAEAQAEEDVLRRASHVGFSRPGLLSFAGGDDLPSALLDAASRLPGRVCVTDGERGAYHVEDGRVANVPAFQVEVRDTLGAGDVWHGAFALALAEGQDEARATRFASAAAALKCTVFGGRKGCPTRAAVEAFLEENP